MSPFRVRKNIAALDQKELDDLVLAFHLLQKVGPGTAEAPNEDSFYTIAGYHGQPFRGAGYGNRDWWGGYCHHGNVLFPTWHRAYVLRLEDALRKVSNKPNLALPYWDEIADSSGFFDNLGRIASDQVGTTTRRVDYSKPKKYETVRCPYSGLVGKDDKDATENYNATISEAQATVQLNRNVQYWLRSPATNSVPGMRQLFIDAAWKAPNYTVFSNTTSAAKWNDDKFAREAEWEDDFVVSVERPHNGVHLAVGGYDMPDKDRHRLTPSQANGDMGENDTAAFDPIFFFHHCFIDMVFWLWQFHHEATENFDIIPFYPGTSPIDSQGPTPGMSADSQLNMETPLTPFRYTTRGVVNIQQLGYSYDCDQYLTKTPPPPPIDVLPLPVPPVTASAPPMSRSAVRVTGISRSQRLGSFVVAIWAFPSDNEHDWAHATLVGLEPVFSRWHVPGCANCSNSLTVTLHAHLPPGPSPTGSDKFKDIHENERKLKIMVLDNQIIKDNVGVPRKRRVLNPITGDSTVDPGPWIEIRKVSG
ncbi:tyrosinase family protein [Aspergillus vadensis CBS 113365]|uniref:tyrosinase n=1 Tax=Aspergillus vadensis (strain CBS 113365 / IMI 142717 / IBT 24658) TaxID=1448311 RepID=A0A319CHX1_ASPVC|nr:Di-copper centre-containing protein [Aspergillus vadensis CBS 113365]PYH67812.1 Di-copper centre-containing protein [Aspergillus vadensis CBS 113365]